jgi:hypothetical protein
MPARKRAIILSICALSVALLFQVSSVKAQTCPVPMCSSGSTCDDFGNCTCNQAPTGCCGAATCNSGSLTWQCPSIGPCEDDCYVPVCTDTAGGGWACEYDESSCSEGGGGGGGTEPLPCNSCDPECVGYSEGDNLNGNCLLV